MAERPDRQGHCWDWHWIQVGVPEDSAPTQDLRLWQVPECWSWPLPVALGRAWPAWASVGHLCCPWSGEWCQWSRCRQHRLSFPSACWGLGSCRLCHRSFGKAEQLESRRAKMWPCCWPCRPGLSLGVLAQHPCGTLAESTVSPLGTSVSLVPRQVIALWAIKPFASASRVTGTTGVCHHTRVPGFLEPVCC